MSRGISGGGGTSMMTLIAEKLPSDILIITYEFWPGILCSDDYKGLIITPYVLS